MRTDVTVADITLDAATGGHTYDWHDMPRDKVFAMGEEVNAAEIYFMAYDTSNNKEFNARLFGYSARGPAELIADMSGAFGLARVNDGANDLYADTLGFSQREHIKGIAVSDSGSDRIAKLALDCVGYKYLYVEFYSICANGRHNAYIRAF